MAASDEPTNGFWAELGGRERDALRAAGSWSRFEADSTIFVEHEDSRHVVVIWSGLTKVTKRVNANRVVLLALRGSGDIIGEMASIAGGRRYATVVAIDNVEALVVKGDAFARLLHQFPQASTVLHRVLVTRLRSSDLCRINAGTMNVGQRLARLLLQLGQRFGEPTGNGDTKIGVALSQNDLAAFVGASPRAVAREMESWRQRGIIATGRRCVVLRRPGELRRIAGSSGRPG